MLWAGRSGSGAATMGCSSCAGVNPLESAHANCSVRESRLLRDTHLAGRLNQTGPGAVYLHDDPTAGGAGTR